MLQAVLAIFAPAISLRTADSLGDARQRCCMLVSKLVCYSVSFDFGHPIA